MWGILRSEVEKLLWCEVTDKGLDARRRGLPLRAQGTASVVPRTVASVSQMQTLRPRSKPTVAETLGMGSSPEGDSDTGSGLRTTGVGNGGYPERAGYGVMWPVRLVFGTGGTRACGEW